MGVFGWRRSLPQMQGVTSPKRELQVDTISRSYDKADEVKFRSQAMTFLFGTGTN
jgi:hypothetical protein